MIPDWTDDLPIYRQLKERVLAAILDGALEEGKAVPSVRSVAVEMRINPVTASKAYSELVEDGLLEKRRGVGMFVRKGARNKALQGERQRFLQEQWPQIQQTIQRLGLNKEDLLQRKLK
jgi:GntR family transcriptional regulator